MSALSARYPQYCRYESLGRSNEGRHLAALSISLNPRSRPRRVAYIQAGTHGREWITPLSVLYFANELLTNIRAFQRVLSDVELYVVPLVNPDGYEYTFTTVSLEAPYTTANILRKNHIVHSKLYTFCN